MRKTIDGASCRLLPIAAAAMSLLGATTTAGAATTTSGVLGSKGQSEQTCLQFLVFAVGQGENCTYGGVVFGLPLQPFGEPTGPFTVNYYYDSLATPQAFSIADGNPTPFTPGFGDGKIEQRITGTVTIDDNNTPEDGADDRISFSLTFRSPGGGSIIRWLGVNLVERYGSMSQTLAPTQVSRATPNLQGGFDYEIASRGFPPLIPFNAPGNDPSNGRTIGTVESGGSFTTPPAPQPDPLRWADWPAGGTLVSVGPPTVLTQGLGFGSLEDNLGVRTTGSVTGSLETGSVDCLDPVPPPANGNCTNSKVAYSPLARGPNNAPPVPLGLTAEDVGFDQLLLKVSTNADGRVTSVAGFDVQESQNFGTNALCGSDPGATIRCNTWTTGYFTLAGVEAVDDGPFAAPVASPVELDVLANDVNFLDPVTVAVTTAPVRGTAVVLGSPGDASGVAIRYTGNPGELGTDTFVYQVTDSVGNTDTASVSVEILDFSAGNDVGTTRLNTPVDISVGANDIGFGDAVVVTLNDDFSAGGSAAVIAGNGGPAPGIVVRYTPVAPPGTSTYTETFSYEISDGDLLSGTATVTVTVTNSVPVAVGGVVAVSTAGRSPDASSGTFTAPGPGGVLGDLPVQVVVTTLPVNGTATVSGNTITYTIGSATFFSGADVFSYRITDTDGETAIAQVAVSIPNALPLLSDGAIFTEQARTSRPFRPSLTFGNGSPEQHVMAIVQQAQSGSCALTATDGTGSVTYQGNPDFDGSDSCQIRLTDGNGDSATATIAITVAPVNEVVGRVGGASSADVWSLLLLGGALLVRRRRWIRGAAVAAVLAVCLAPASPALAQSSGEDEAGPPSPAPAGVGEIVVTARKVAESLKDVPLSITAFDAATIQAAGIANLADVADLTPGLSFFNAFGENLPIPVIRGVAPTDIFGQNNAAVFIDGVFISGREGLNFSQLDLERIEVVKGPQSAQYGRTAFSGALNYVTKDPGDEFEAKVLGEAGNFGKRRGNVMLSGPIAGETLTGRISFLYDEWDGAYDNPLSDVDVGGYRYRSWQGKLLWKPMDELRVSLAYYKSNDDIDDPAAVSLPTNCEDRVDDTPEVRLQDFCGEVPKLRSVPTQQGRGDIKKVAQATGENRDLDRVILRADWDVASGFTVTSLTGFLKTVQNNVADFGNNMGNDLPFLYCIGAPDTPGVPNSCLENPADLRHFSGLYNPNADDQTDEWSQEIRFSSPQDQRLRFGGGLYAFSSKFTAGPGAQIATVPLPDLGPDAQPGLAPFDPTAPNFAVGTAIFWNTFTPDGGRDPLLRTVLREDTDSWAIFASSDFDVTDRLTALAEIRYVQESQVRRQYLYELCANRTTPECGDDRFDLRATGPAEVVKASARFDSLIGRVGLRFKVNDDWMIYGSIAEGEKPGGLRLINANVIDPETSELIPSVLVNPFELEKLTAYELGAKGVLFDRLSIDAAVFYNDWRDIVLRQLQETDPESGDLLEQPVGFNVNAGSAGVLGLELSAALQITDRWRATGSAGWVDAELRDAAQDQFGTYPTFAPDGNVSGNKLLRQPEWDASASLSYDREFGSDWKWYARGDVTYQSGVYVGNNNQSWLPDRTYVNGRIGFRSSRYTIELWGRNLFENEEPIAAFRDIFFTNTDSVTPPFTDLGPRPGFDKFPPLRYTVSYPRLRQVGINFEMRFGGLAR